MSEPSRLAALCEAAGTKFILALFVDLNGKPCAKLVPVESAEQLATEGAGFAGYAVGAIGQEPKDPDLIAIPDPASFTPVPFVKEGLAIVHCDPHVLGEPWPFAPRNILKALIQQAADAGFEPWVGAEVEYFLLKRNATGELGPADDDDTAARPCYDARGVTRMYDHLTAISSAMNQLGWGNYANDHEDGSGQFEQNFRYADALTTADRVITLRYLLNVLAACREANVSRVVVVTSADVYGKVTPDQLPLDEDTPMRPVSPYGASKVAADYICLQAFLGHGMHVVRARPFTHIGPGQSDRFVASALASRIAKAERDGVDEIPVGTLDTRRDFTDVRDVVRAYRLLALHGEPGEAYNICTGVDISIQELADTLVALSTRPIRLVPDPALLRPADLAVLRGDATKLHQLTGWKAEIPLGVTLADLLDDWRARI